MRIESIASDEEERIRSLRRRKKCLVKMTRRQLKIKKNRQRFRRYGASACIIAVSDVTLRKVADLE